MKYLEVFATLI